MKRQLGSYTVLVRSAWVTIAVFMIICCGPVKKLIGLRGANKGIVTSSLNSDNKLRTSYREKQEIAPFTYSAVHQSPDTGLALFFIASVFLSLLLVQEVVYSKSQYVPVKDVSGIPLYLRLRKLQV